jgi:hypothetical protein
MIVILATTTTTAVKVNTYRSPVQCIVVLVQYLYNTVFTFLLGPSVPEYLADYAGMCACFAFRVSLAKNLAEISGSDSKP